MEHDHDLQLLRSERNEQLHEAIPKEYWPVPGKRSSCVPSGSLIDTPQGQRAVEHLRPGDEVLSIRLRTGNDRVRAKITHVATSTSTRCIRMNQSWLVTPGQPVRTATEWVPAGAIKLGDRVMNGDGILVRIRSLEAVEGLFEVFDLSVDDVHENYVANGLLCHNKTK